ncbi:MAG TPA: OmpA family protein [Bacteroidia bacterium]|nr:OmpA family protein [Bacteroidia bacterium]
MSDIYFTRIMSKEELEAMLPKPLTIYFKLNSYMISGESKPVMEEVVKILEQNQELKVIITGYTCSIGNENQNQKLSEMRAGSAMDFLLAYGIGVDRIEIGAVGESKAGLADQSEEVQKMFRKVEIRFDYLY